VLEIPSTATQTQVREAYKKSALKNHPDRVPADSPERTARTRKFQQVNDAYYTLSDPTRRRDYDEARRFTGFGTGANASSSGSDDAEYEVPRPEQQAGGGGPGAFNWSSFFGGHTEQERTERSDEQFRSAYEEMLREEGMADGDQQPTGKFWSFVGGLSGGALGFIVANFPGAVAGAVAGNRLGAVRDSKGKSVYEVFQTLPQAEKARLLSDLAAKIFAHAVSG
jgi:curved DNA-binding protein CbpA